MVPIKGKRRNPNRVFENGGSTDPEKTGVKKRRFRYMTPEEVAAEGLPTEESYERGELPRATFRQQLDIYSQQAEEAGKKFGEGSAQQKKFIRLMDNMLKQQALERVRSRR